ncbi:MAG: DUF1232 domain-containing protein [Verrucomicrobia bacterium]|nr:DUF1232 domain-containing protein [Verrucomicrobiota bacterium]
MKKFEKKDIVAGALGIFSVVYLLNPTAGFLEFIPDNLPVFGNLDEAAVTAILVGVLAYFGLDINKLFKGSSTKSARHRQREEVIEAEAQPIPRHE